MPACKPPRYRELPGRPPPHVGNGSRKSSGEPGNTGQGPTAASRAGLIPRRRPAQSRPSGRKWQSRASFSAKSSAKWQIAEEYWQAVGRFARESYHLVGGFRPISGPNGTRWHLVAGFRTVPPDSPMPTNARELLIAKNSRMAHGRRPSSRCQPGAPPRGECSGYPPSRQLMRREHHANHWCARCCVRLPSSIRSPQSSPYPDSRSNPVFLVATLRAALRFHRDDDAGMKGGRADLSDVLQNLSCRGIRRPSREIGPLLSGGGNVPGQSPADGGFRPANSRPRPPAGSTPSRATVRSVEPLAPPVPPAMHVPL